MNASKWRLVVGLRELTRRRKRLAFLGWANHGKVNALGEMKDEALLVTCDMCMPLGAAPRQAPKHICLWRLTPAPPVGKGGKTLLSSHLLSLGKQAQGRGLLFVSAPSQFHIEPSAHHNPMRRWPISPPAVDLCCPAAQLPLAPKKGPHFPPADGPLPICSPCDLKLTPSMARQQALWSRSG